MRSSIIAGLLALTSSVLAQDTYWSNQSAPFYLVIKSKNDTLNGKYLGACHEGAAIEGFCVAGPSKENFVTFNYNTSAQESTPVTGLLTWSLQIGGGSSGVVQNVSSAMRLSYSPSSNVAIPVLFPGNSENTPVAFAANGKLGIFTYQDDTKPLPNYNNTLTYRWYVCTTYYGYLYQTLAWTLGNHSPQNPTCQKVDVYRKFVS
jgi:hypothetical protein